MCPYYITARNNSKKLSIPVENKHIYGHVIGTNYNESISSDNDIMIKYNEGFTTQSTLNSSVSDHVTTKNDFQILYKSDVLKVERGTDFNERIGDKVFVERVDIDYSISVSIDFINWVAGINDDNYAELGSQASRLNSNWFINCRLMLVHFDFDLGQTDYFVRWSLAQWFNRVYCYHQTQVSYPSDSSIDLADRVNSRSVHTVRKHESTEYNGKYQIIKDQMITLTPKKTVYNGTMTINPKMDLTFNSDDEVTSEKWKNTYLILIGPNDYRFDMDPYSTKAIEYVGASVNSKRLFNTAVLAKWTFYDLN